MPKKSKSSRSVSSKRQETRAQRAAQQNRNKLWVSLGLAAIAIVVIVLLRMPKSSQPIEISASLAYQKFQEGAYILDVRTQEEYDQAHIEGSILIPLDEIENHLDELPRDGDILVVCLMETRSKEAVSILRSAGFENVACINGGLNAWTSAGYPLVSSNQ